MWKWEELDIKKVLIGGNKIYKGKAIVCYLDLLGFSNAIRREWNNKEKNPLDEVLSLKKTITSKENQTGLILNMHHGSGEKESRVYVYNTKFISDSIIITMPIDGIMTIADVHFAILGIFNNIAKYWAMCLDNGYTVRGGIDYGDVYWNETDIIGPAYMDVYILESDIAKISRVVCGDGLIKLIDNINEKMGYKNEALVRNLVYDVDGLLCVNPNLMYDTENMRIQLSNRVSELMEGKSAYIKHKFLTLHKMLINRDRLLIPSNEELRKYSVKM